MELNGKNVAIIGMGKTGIATADFLYKNGASMTCFDQKPLYGIANLNTLKSGNAKIIDNWDGKHVGKFDFVIVSPGVPMSLEGITEARTNGIEVISEIELACRFTDKKIIGITGTNGKSTTVTVAGQILNNAGIKTGVGGNIGTPFIELINHDQGYGLYLLELSSYQLEGIITFRPWISVLLNITEDHLDRYGNMNEYTQAKFRIFMNQSQSDYAIINAEDVITVKSRHKIRAKTYSFSINKRNRRGAYYNNNKIVYVDGSENKSEFTVKNPSLNGVHNIQNTMAGIIIARLLDVPDESIQSTLDKFKGLSHRIELVSEINKIKYYDDSKATNVDSVRVALKSFTEPVILIMGGRDKGGDYSPLSELIKIRVKLLIVMGEARENILNAFRGMVDCIVVRDMEEAVNKSYEHARAGDVVLLSPACSSFDMFRDYKQRGDVFKEAVLKLTKENAHEGI